MLSLRSNVEFVGRERNFFVCEEDYLLFMFTQITLGRATKDKPIDVDLSLEGPAWKISRKQGENWHIIVP